MYKYLWRYIVFPTKIKLTDDYIALIVTERKKHNLTAYQLSEKIGKNKSWLPNIENHRTKNIFRTDFFLIFDDFAKEEHISTELYIIKYLTPNAVVTLDDGNSVLCQTLKAQYNLIDSAYEYDLHDTEPYEQIDFALLKHAFHDLEYSITGVFDEQSHSVRRQIIEALKTIRHIYSWDAEIANAYYMINITGFCEGNPPLYKQEISQLIDNTSKEVDFIVAKSTVYSYFSTSEAQYSLNRDLAISLCNPVDHDKKEELLKDIERYLFKVYNFVTLAFKQNKISAVDFHKIYSMTDKFFKEFVALAKLNYNVDFPIPKGLLSEAEFNQLHLQVNDIFFQIKQLFSNTK